MTSIEYIEEAARVVRRLKETEELITQMRARPLKDEDLYGAAVLTYEQRKGMALIERHEVLFPEGDEAEAFREFVLASLEERAHNYRRQLREMGVAT